MGQPIQVRSKTVLEKIAMFGTDRGVTGQDGSCHSPSDDSSGGIPARLAGEIFATDGAIEHVFVVSNQVVVRREGGWDDVSLQATGAVISRFFVFYDDAGS